MSEPVRYMPSIPLGEFIDYLYVDPGADSAMLLGEYIRPTHPVMAIHTKPVNGFSQQGKIKGIFTRAPKNDLHEFSNHSIGIRFKPYGLYTGFGIPGESVANRIIPSPVLFSSADLENVSALLQSGNRQAAIEHVHNVLYNQLAPKPLLYEITDIVEALVETDLSKNAQRDLARAFERSPKSFIEIFRKAIGVTPLHYLHIHKIDAARRMIREQPGIALTDVAYTLGFYDQSHFTRVFKSHAGSTPFQYKASLNLDPVNSVQF